jgi:hypothetical protein
VQKIKTTLSPYPRSIIMLFHALCRVESHEATYEQLYCLTGISTETGLWYLLKLGIATGLIEIDDGGHPKYGRGHKQKARLTPKALALNAELFSEEKEKPNGTRDAPASTDESAANNYKPQLGARHLG